MSPLAGVAAVARDPILRLAALALALWGVVSASVAPYQSLIGIKLLHLPPMAYAAVLATAAIVSVTSSVAAGLLADQYAQRRRVAVVLACSLVAGVALMRLFPSRTSFALTHGLFVPAAAGLFGQLFALMRIGTAGRPSAERERIAAISRAAVSLTFVGVLPLWALAIRSGVPLVDTYSLGLVAALAVLALILRQWPADADLPDNRRSGLSFRAGLAELARPAVMLRIAALGLTVSSVSTYMAVLGPMFAATGRGNGMVALFAGLVAGIEIPAMMAGAGLLSRWSKTRVIVLGALVHAGFMLSFAASAHLGPVLLLTVPAGFGAGLVLTIPLGYVQDLLGHRPGAGGALIAMHQFLTAGFGALAFALGMLAGGYSAVCVIAALFALTGAALLTFLDRHRPAAIVG